MFGSEPLLAVSATFTAEPVGQTLAFWMEELGLPYQVRFAPYHQVFQQLLDQHSLLASNRSGINVVLVRLEDWGQDLEQNAHDLVAHLEAAARTFAAPLIVALCPASPIFAERQRQTEESMLAGLRAVRGVHVIAPEELTALYPVADAHDPHAEQLGRVPYTPEFFAALGTALARKVHMLRATPLKVVALDCDETLWQGICGEDGPEGVVVDPPRRALQEFMLCRREAGMLLALASKNNLDDVIETFKAHPEMPLRLDHFVARRVNWEPKPANLVALADELELGLDSFILIDDNAKEVSEVKANCPEVAALALPADAMEIPRFLQHVWAFDRTNVTEEDRRRNAMYAERLERARAEREASSLEEFLASLQLEVRITPMKNGEASRVAQLTQRTSQMNFTLVRRSEAEIQALAESGEAECWTVRVSDRFGDYGLTGVMIFRAGPDVLAIDTFLLSCRALGRGVEHRMIATLGELAERRGIPAIVARFVRSQRNQPALLLLESVAAPSEDDVFRIAAHTASLVRHKPGSIARSSPREAAAGARAERGRQIDYQRIANQLATPARVLEAVRARTGRMPAVRGSHGYVVPRTDLERRLAQIWAEALNVQRVGVHDNFFDLGGHSLLAVELLSRVRRALGVDVSLEVVYMGEFTVAELAKAIELREIEQAGADEYAALLAELENLTDDEARALLEKEDHS